MGAEDWYVQPNGQLAYSRRLFTRVAIVNARGRGARDGETRLRKAGNPVDVSRSVGRRNIEKSWYQLGSTKATGEYGNVREKGDV